MNKALTKHVLFALIGLTACRTRTFDPELSTPQATLPDNNGFIYTLLENNVAEGNGNIAEFDAHVDTGLRRFVRRKVGYFRKLSESNGHAKYDSYTAPGSTLETICTPSSATCQVSAKLIFAASDSSSVFLCQTENATLPHMDSGTLLLNCKNGDVSKTLALFKAQTVEPHKCIHPNPNFEYFRSGPMFTGDGQCLLRLPAVRTIRFAIHPTLVADAAFMQGLQKAMSYWNTTIGREVFSKDFTTTESFVFDPFVSQIRFNNVNSSTFATGGSVHHPLNGEILSLKVNVNAGYKDHMQDLVFLMAHELGHALGLAHNFAGSEDLPNRGAALSSTVMDYVFGLQTDTPLSYDAAAMQYIYQNKPAATSFRHCNDTQVSYRTDCNRFEDPSEASENIANILYTLSQDKYPKIILSALRGTYNGDEASFYRSAPFKLQKSSVTSEIAMLMAIGNSLKHWSLGYRAYWFDKNILAETRELIKKTANNLVEALAKVEDPEAAPLSQNEIALFKWMKERFEKPAFNFNKPNETIVLENTSAPEPSTVDKSIDALVKGLPHQ